MHISSIAALHQEAGTGSPALANQVVMHCTE